MSNPNLYVKKRTTVNEIFNNDPERIELYNKIVESLITAGYFRARINSLEPFDKILGGMAWILTGCFYYIDIDGLGPRNEELAFVNVNGGYPDPLQDMYRTDVLTKDEVIELRKRLLAERIIYG